MYSRFDDGSGFDPERPFKDLLVPRRLRVELDAEELHRKREERLVADRLKEIGFFLPPLYVYTPF